MSTATRGNTAEGAVLYALAKQGFDVLVPFGSGQPYDLVLGLPDGRFLRVQVKTAWPLGGCLLFNCRSSDHGRGPVPYEGLADVFGVYFPPTQAVYLVPVQAMKGFRGRLRLEPARNSQRSGDPDGGRVRARAVDGRCHGDAHGAA